MCAAQDFHIPCPLDNSEFAHIWISQQIRKIISLWNFYKQFFMLVKLVYNKAFIVTNAHFVISYKLNIISKVFSRFNYYWSISEHVAFLSLYRILSWWQATLLLTHWWLKERASSQIKRIAVLNWVLVVHAVLRSLFVKAQTSISCWQIDSAEYLIVYQDNELLVVDHELEPIVFV